MNSCHYSMEVRAHVAWMVALLASATLAGVGSEDDVPHSRQKRIIWLTNDGRLALPPGTTMVITPSLTMPFVRYPPEGFLSNMSISLPFTIDFDKLGLTDNQNPYGVLPPIFSRSMGRMTGMLLADYVGQLLDRRRHSRATPPPPPPPNAHFHGGERALLYGVAEDFLSNFGMDGKACLLRAMCEIHGQHIYHLGFIGEILKLFFTASKSPYAHMLEEYVEAEQKGENLGECFPYYKDCPKSLFLGLVENKYKKDASDHLNDDGAHLQSLHNSATGSSNVVLEPDSSSRSM